MRTPTIFKDQRFLLLKIMQNLLELKSRLVNLALYRKTGFEGYSSDKIEYRSPEDMVKSFWFSMTTVISLVLEVLDVFVLSLRKHLRPLLPRFQTSTSAVEFEVPLMKPSVLPVIRYEWAHRVTKRCSLRFYGSGKLELELEISACRDSRATN
ncbi:hypothetical protein Tco_1335576 [Tanacetum coccineum]